MIALTGGTANAARGHVLCEACRIAPSDEHALSEPSGVAVNEASGDVYVIDTHNDRVEYFTAAGAFAGEFKGPSTTGSGSLTAGETTVTGVLTAGAFSVGEEVSAVEGLEQGLEPGTTIETVDRETGTLTLSKAATKTMVSAELSAHQAFRSLPARPKKSKRRPRASRSITLARCTSPNRSPKQRLLPARNPTPRTGMRM